MKSFMDGFSSDTNFYNAVKRGNIQEVEDLYNAAQGKTFGKIDINWQNSGENYKTPLKIAVINKNVELIKFLLEKGAQLNPSYVSENQLSPLLYAINQTPRDVITLEIVNLLLENGARPNLGYIPPYNAGYQRQRPQAITPVTIVRNWPNDGNEGKIKRLILDAAAGIRGHSVATIIPTTMIDDAKIVTNPTINLSGSMPIARSVGEVIEPNQNLGGGRRRRRKTNKKRKTSKRRKTGKRRRR